MFQPINAPSLLQTWKARGKRPIRINDYFEVYDLPKFIAWSIKNGDLENLTMVKHQLGSENGLRM